MEKRSGEGLARLQIPKPNSRIESRVCSECQRTFEDKIWIKGNGDELPGEEKCPECREREKAAEAKEFYEGELAGRSLEQRAKWRLQYGIEGMFQSKTFEGFNSDVQPKAFTAVSNWTSGSLVLLSPGVYGVGKTHLVSALANRLVETEATAHFEPGSYHIVNNPCPVYFTNESHLLSRIRDTYNDGAQESDEHILAGLNRFRLLIIDDVGKVKPRDYGFLQSVYFRVINDRYEGGRHIILTTNFNTDELEKHIGEACGDRLCEMCGKKGFITMKGESYRLRK